MHSRQTVSWATHDHHGPRRGSTASASNHMPLPPGSPVNTLWGPVQPSVCAPGCRFPSRWQRRGTGEWCRDKHEGQGAGSSPFVSCQQAAKTLPLFTVTQAELQAQRALGGLGSKGESSQSVLGLGGPRMETPGGRQGIWGPTRVPERGWKKWESLRTREQWAKAAAGPSWVLTLEAGQIGVLRFDFQEVWQPRIAVPEPTALGVGSVEVSGAGHAFVPAATATTPPTRLTFQSRTRIQLVWAQGRCS